MSATEAPRDFSDLFIDLTNRIREQTGITAVEEQAKRYINLALQDMHINFVYIVPWAERHATLRTRPPYTTGTMGVTEGLASVTGTGTAWATNDVYGVANVRAGGKVKVNGREETYEVATVTNDTTLTFTESFIGTTDTTAEYTYFEDEYDLASDFFRLVDTQTFDLDQKIEIVSRTKFRRRYVRNQLTGTPTIAMIIQKAFGSDTSAVRRIRLYRAPDLTYLLPYAYITENLAVTAAGVEQEMLINDTDEPIVPLKYRHALTFFALAEWYRDKKDDVSRYQAAFQRFTDIMLRLSVDQEIAMPRPRLRNDIRRFIARAKSPYRRTSGRSSAGSRFDELRDRF
jgi:hypothetical protein